MSDERDMEVNNDRRSARRLLAMIRPYSGRMTLAVLCSLVASVGFIAIPLAIKSLVDGALVHHDAASLNRTILLLLGAVLFSAMFAYWRSSLLAYIGSRMVADLRTRLYTHLQRLSISFYDEHRAGDLASRATADTALVQSVFTTNLVGLLGDVIRFFAALVIIIVLDWRLALLILVLAPLIALISILVGRRSRRLSEEAQTELGRSNVVLEETISAMRVVKAFGREGYEIDRYRSASDASFRISYEAGRLRALFEALMITIAYLSIGGIFWYGGHEVLAGHLTPGTLISFVLYLGMLTGPIQSFAGTYGQFQQAAGAARRVFEVLDTTPEIIDSPDAYDLPAVDGQVTVRDLWFAYRKDQPDVLKGVSLTIEPGQTLALVGPSGAGKTSLTSLLLRFYEPNRGSITLDGRDQRRVTASSWRDAIAIVPQDPTLFGDTVRENIAYGREGASQSEIEDAARAANAHDFIENFSDGYDTIVGDRGVKLSGGQRQRIAIARAILKDPRFLILDEATSSLDNESESLVQDALARLMMGRTTLVIAHRLSTVENADQIVVLNAGCVVERGTHAELLAHEGLYHRLYTRAFHGSGDISDKLVASR